MESNIELLIVIKNIEKYFDKDSIHEFMSRSMNIKIEQNFFIYEKIRFDFSTHLFKHVDKCQQFELHIIIPENAPENTIIGLIDVVKSRMRSINKATDVRLIWDGYSIRYNIEAYSIINILENLFRKAISKFMITNFGVDWLNNNNVSKNIIEKRRRNANSQNRYLDSIFVFDIDDLIDFLFYKYRLMDEADFESIFVDNSDSVSLDKISNFRLKNNWERYFEKIFEIPDSILKDKWDKITKLRNDVAHNRFLTYEKICELRELNEFVLPILQKGIASIEKLHLTESEKYAFSRPFGTTRVHRMNQITTRLNVGISTIVEFLTHCGFKNIEPSPNFKLNYNHLAALSKEFRVDLLKNVETKEISENNNCYSPDVELVLEGLRSVLRYPIL